MTKPKALEPIVVEFLDAVRTYGKQQYISEQTGIGQSTISSWFTRGSIPSLEHAARVAKIIGFKKKLG